MSSLPRPRRRPAISPRAPTGHGAAIWRCCGSSAASRSRFRGSLRTNSRSCRTMAWALPAPRPGHATTLPLRRRAPASTTLSVTWPLVISRPPRPSGRSSCSRARSCRPLPKPDRRSKGESMRFGIFDHLDDSGLPLDQHFEARLKPIEAYDRAGFYGYHLAEHHNTPLGYAPSPGAFLAAVAQRTRQLRFGPMVYLLPLYHPLRLIDEICMLDQMSNGRFLYGVGRGISPVEVGFYGIDFATGAEQFRECFEVTRIGLTEDEVTFHGKFY